MSKTIFFFVFFCSSIARSQIATVEIKNNWDYFSTIDSTYAEDQKDRHTKIYFNEEDQKKVVQLADSFFFWDLPDTLKAEKNADDRPCPGITMVHIKTKEYEKTVRFDCTFENLLERNNIRGLQSAIYDIVHKKPEYLALPERRLFRE